MMQIEARWLHWMDEGQPQIGSGVRLCEIKRGRQFVHVREAQLVQASWKKFTLNEFGRLFPECESS